jgi:hypothetical protein
MTETYVNDGGPKETHPSVHCDAAEVQRVLEIMRRRFPYLLLSVKDVDLIWHWLWQNEAVGGFSEYNVNAALIILDYAKQLEHCPTPAPPKPAVPPTPIEPAEVLLKGEISIKAGRWELEQASPAQIRSYLKRLRAHNKTG